MIETTYSMIIRLIGELINFYLCVEITNFYPIAGILWHYYAWPAGLSLLSVALVSVACKLTGPFAKYHYHLKLALCYLASWSSLFVLWPIFALRPNNGHNFWYVGSGSLSSLTSLDYISVLFVSGSFVGS